MSSLKNLYSQWFPPSPSFTENEVPCQQGKVFIITGGNSGVGFELCKMLYSSGATIYIAARSKEKVEKAIKTITEVSQPPKTPAVFKFLQYDLNDIKIVKDAAAAFAEQESRLDVLWNNAGTGASVIQPGARTVQGFPGMIGMNCIATLLFTLLLLPQLRAAVTATSQVPGSVRVVWTASYMVEAQSPPNGVDFNLLQEGTLNRNRNYAESKAGTWMLSREMAKRYGKDGIVSVALNPGNLKTDAYGGNPAFTMFLINRILYEPKYGGYTQIYAGLSPEVTLESNGAYIIPWGRIRADKDCSRRDIIKAMTPVNEGGLGYSRKFWEWCEEQWKPHMGQQSVG